ncbi:hypothetical protein RHSIM_Rhsim07G0129600 [Rhododendron simsii]|uniref:Uncharacterized protein n=1 Tax=Rhododendron simsii TaxID=118357 RepID=A0A834GSM8_RHOSS|nr:hypothetical protein RHSIM_Rhsim07G0129600 [Rhododendron simsii]
MSDEGPFPGNKEAAKNDTETKEREEGEIKKPKKVPFRKLFAFADTYDWFLMSVGSVGACIHGASVPVFFVFFGKIINVMGMAYLFPAAASHRVAKYSLDFVYLSLVVLFSSWTEASTGDVICSITSDIIVIQDAISEKVGNFIHYISRFIAGFSIGFFMVWQISLVTLSIVPLIALAGGVYAFVVTGLVARVIGNVRTVQAFAGEEMALRSYRTALLSTYQYGKKAGLAKGLGLGTLHCVLFLSWSLLVWFTSIVVHKNIADGGKSFTTMLNVVISGLSLGQAAPDISAFISAKTAAYPIFEMIERNTLSQTSSKNGRKLDNIEGHIQFTDVCFSYPSRPDVMIFNKLNLDIPSGKVVALVGASGSGKSTVISLIERFYEPLSGQILLDGTDIWHLDLKWLRKQIGLVNQEPALFATTIRENILYGKNDATIEEITRAARLSEAIGFIRNLSDGFETQVPSLGRTLGRPLSIKSPFELSRTSHVSSLLSDKALVVRIGAHGPETITQPRVSSGRLYSMACPEWIYGVAGTICALIAGAQMPLFALGITQALVSYYMDWDTTTREVKKISLLFCGGAAITVIVHVITHLSFGIMGERLTLRVREMMFSAILKNEIGWFDDINNTSSMLASRLEGDATLLRNIVVDRSTILIQNSGLVVTSFIIAFMLNWRITLVVMATYPLIISGHLSEKMFMKGYGGNLSKAYLKANMLASESVSNIRTVIAFCSEEKVLDLYAQELVDPSRKSFTRGQIAGIFFGVTQFFIFSSYGLALWYGSVLMGKELSSFESIMKTFMVLIVTALAMGSTLAMAPDLLKGNQMVASVFELLDREAKVIGDSGEELASVEGMIELRGVQFSYPSRPNELIFGGFDLIVCAGQSMALVGRSGSGKSSVLALVLRFYDPTAGNVMIDDPKANAISGIQFTISRRTPGIMSGYAIVPAVRIVSTFA